METISAEQQARQALTARILELEEAQGEGAGLRQAQLEEALQKVSTLELHSRNGGLGSVSSSDMHKASHMGRMTRQGRE